MTYGIIEIISIDGVRDPNGLLFEVIKREVAVAFSIEALKDRNNVLKWHRTQCVHFVANINVHVAILRNDWRSGSVVFIRHGNSAMELPYASVPVESVELKVPSKTSYGQQYNVI